MSADWTLDRNLSFGESSHHKAAITFILRRPLKSRDGDNYNLKLGGKLGVVLLAKAYGADLYGDYSPGATWTLTDSGNTLFITGITVISSLALI